MPGPQGEESDDQRGAGLLEELVNKYGNEGRHNVRESRVDDDVLGNLYSAATGGVVIESTCTAAILFWCSREGMRFFLGGMQFVTVTVRYCVTHIRRIYGIL